MQETSSVLGVVFATNLILGKRMLSSAQVHECDKIVFKMTIVINDSFNCTVNITLKDNGCH